MNDFDSDCCKSADGRPKDSDRSMLIDWLDLADLQPKKGKDPSSVANEVELSGLLALNDRFTSAEGDSKKSSADLLLGAAGAIVDKTKAAETRIDCASLSPDKQEQLLDTIQMQTLISRSLTRLYPDEKERREFTERFERERIVVDEANENIVRRLPTLGDCTKEAMQKLSANLSMRILQVLETQNERKLPTPAGLILSRDGVEGLNRENLIHELKKGSAALVLEKPEDWHKCVSVLQWIKKSEQDLSTHSVHQLRLVYSQLLEEKIEKGRYPASWRYKEGADEKSWVERFEQAFGTYESFINTVEGLHYLWQSQGGDKEKLPESLKPENLPAGVSLVLDGRKNAPLTIEFRRPLPGELEPESLTGRASIFPLSRWLEDHRQELQRSLKELQRPQHEMPGYCEIPFKSAWVNPKTQKIEVGRTDCPGGDWKRFNLLRHDFELGENSDGNGQVREFVVKPVVRCEDHSVLSYQNLFGESVHNFVNQPRTYQPDEFVAVQVGPGDVELVKANELSHWRTVQQCKSWLDKSLSGLMDAAMLVSGTIELRAASKVLQLGAKNSLKGGADAALSYVPAHLANQSALRSFAGGTASLALGAGGLLHSAGAQEYQALQILSSARSGYFVAHPVWNIVVRPSWKGIHSLSYKSNSEIAPGAMDAAFKLAQAREIGLNESGRLWRAAQAATARASQVADVAFGASLFWHGRELYLRSERLDRATLLSEARASARGTESKEGGLPVSVLKAADLQELLVKRLGEFKDQQFNGRPSVVAEGLISKTRILCQSKASPEERQEFLSELIKHFRYSGERIGQLRAERRNISDRQVLSMAQSDKVNFDPALQRVAAACMLALSQSEDGSYPQVVAFRDCHVPSYSFYIGGGGPGGIPVRQEVPASSVRQELSSRELIDMLQSDYLTEETLPSLPKTRVLADLGLISTSHYGAVLLAHVESLKSSGSVSDPVKERSSGECRSIILELTNVIARQKAIEIGRSLATLEAEGRSDASCASSAAGMELRLSKLAANMADPNLQASALSALTYLRKESLDDVDRQRLHSMLSGTASETHSAFRKQLEQDLELSEADTKSAGLEGRPARERKLLAATMLAENICRGEKCDLVPQVAKALRECSESRDYAIAQRAIRFLLVPEEKGAFVAEVRANVDLLSEYLPDKTSLTRSKCLIAAANLIGRPPSVLESPRLSPVENLRISEEFSAHKVQLIQTLIPVLARSNSIEHKSLVAGTLLSLLNQGRTGTGTGVLRPMENNAAVRIAALDGLRQLQVRGALYQQLYKTRLADRLDPSLEVDPSVRLAAARAANSLLFVHSDRQEIMSNANGRKKKAETDMAVREILQEFRAEEGSASNGESAQLRELMLEAQRRQSKTRYSRDEVHSLFKGDYSRLLQSKDKTDILEYLPKPEPWLAQIKQCSAFVLNPAYREDPVAAEAKIELKAQSLAYETYMKQINELIEIARTGNAMKNVSLPGHHSPISERDSSLLMLGYLLSSESQMGRQFWQHNARQRDDQPDAGKVSGFRAFSPTQLKARAELLNDKSFKPGYRAFTADPWPLVQDRIASGLLEISQSSDAKTNLSLLQDQLLTPFKREDIKLCASQRKLIDVLDGLVSREGADVTMKKECCDVIAQALAKSSLADGGEETALAMLNFLDKHFSSSPNLYSKENRHALATAVSSRADSGGLSSPTIALRAQQIEDKHFHSVMAVIDATPTDSNANIALRKLLLPGKQEMELLNVTSTAPNQEAIVLSAIQKICGSMKGAALQTDDPREPVLRELIKSTYHDRVRLASAIALCDLETLAELAATAKHPVLRREAFGAACENGISLNLLNRWQTSAEREFVSKMRKCLSLAEQEESKELVPMLLTKAKTLTESSPDSVDPLKSFLAASRRSILDRFAEQTAMCALGHARRDLVGRDSAEIMLKQALETWGVDAKFQERLTTCATKDGLINSDFMSVDTTYNREVSKLADELLKRHAHSQCLPLLIDSLIAFARINSDNRNREVDGRTPALSVGLLSLAKKLAESQYRHEPMAKCKSMSAIADAFVAISADRWSLRQLPLSNYFLPSARGLYDAAAAELTRESRNALRGNLKCEELIQALQTAGSKTLLLEVEDCLSRLPASKQAAISPLQMVALQSAARLNAKLNSRVREWPLQAAQDMARYRDTQSRIKQHLDAEPAGSGFFQCESAK